MMSQSSDLRSTLKARFAELPFNTGRIAKHINDGDVMLGDFLQTYEAIRVKRIKSRPAGRDRFSAGDRAVYTMMNGRESLSVRSRTDSPNRGSDWEVVWVVSAVDEGVVYIEVTLAHEARGSVRYASIVWEGGKATSSAYACEADRLAIEELVEPIDYSRELSKIDAWDWSPGIASHGYNITPWEDEDSVNDWLVSTRQVSFVWDSAANTVRFPHKVAGDNVKYIASLFERPPTIV